MPPSAGAPFDYFHVNSVQQVRDGDLIDARFVANNSSYRAYRFQWTGTPRTSPDIAASAAGANTAVYASWNGATQVASWRVLAGGAPNQLRPVATVAKRGFETHIEVPAAGDVAVQALGAHGRTLGTSKIVQPTS
jgi:hypothetical protein